MTESYCDHQTCKDVHASAIVIDGCCPGEHFKENTAQWVAGGVHACVVTIGSTQPARDVVINIGNWYRHLREESATLRLATSADEVAAAKDDGRLAVVFQFQGSHPVEYQLELLEVYYRLGVRMIQLTYNHRSPVGDGCEEPNDAGLSRFGAAVVQEMNRLGMVIDLSHTGRRTTLDAIQVSDQPCVFSHSNVNGVHPNGRNIDDDQVRALAEKGGVIGVNAFPPFVSGDREPTVDQLVDHVDYIVQLVGDRHVSIGLDYYTRNLPMKVYEDNIRTGRWKRENYSPPPWRYAVEDPTRIPEITCRLVQRGYPAESIHRIMGANLLGLFETVWR